MLPDQNHVSYSCYLLLLPIIHTTMILTNKFDGSALVSDIVTKDYRTADVFRKHGINFCCGGKIPLDTICDAMGLDQKEIEKELKLAVQTINISSFLAYHEWDIGFLTDFIVHVHHAYLKKALPEIKDYLERFVEGHRKKYPYLNELQVDFMSLKQELLPHLQEEEEIIFPYIKQISHAYLNQESYGGLLVRTLRKPVENIMNHENEMVNKMLKRLREHTDNYTLPENPCVNHKVTFSKLRELDNDLVHHMHLENNILFPKAISMEKELLQKHS